jgi:ubiquinone/menaquinone biosynthesis C-methylase UbiE
MRQRDIFLAGEGDAWFARNMDSVGAAQDDPLLEAITALPLARPAPVKLLEIGCGAGSRLAWLSQHLGMICHGIDPSTRAVEAARQRGVDAQRGTAESLPFADRMFDCVVFGFCLYLCDRDDLFRVATEADRVLAEPGWMLILDFYSPFPTRRRYHHREGVFSYKMDYRNLFCWHPAYSIYSHKVFHHSTHGYTDDPNEWTAVSVLRKVVVDR